MLQTPPVSEFHAILDNIKTVAETVGILFGGVWGYYKFFKGRTFKSRLELTVTGNAWTTKHETYATACVQLKNVGLSRVVITQRGSALQFHSALNNVENAADVVNWNREITLAVFEKHGWIEPGESISDQAMIVLTNNEYQALKLSVRLVAGGIEWNSLAIIQPITNKEPKRRSVYVEW